MRFTLIAVSAIFTLASPTSAAPERNCSNGTCRIELTPPQLLVAAERLISERHYSEALPLVEALHLAPGFKLQTEFLGGLIASRTGDYATAANKFMAILANDPSQTRVRLELAQALIALRKTASADRQLRIAQQDTELPQQIAKTIRTVRDTIRSGRTWRFDFNIGIAPDTNINNATSAQSITVLLGEDAYQADLNEEAKAHSGVGLTAQLSAGLRFPVSKQVSALAEIDANGTNYSGSQFDDYNLQTSAGAEYRVTPTSSVSIEGIYSRRWFGGKAATGQIGARTGGQMVLSKRDRFGYQVDVRHVRAYFDRGYDGWQGGLYGTIEHAIARTLVVSAGPFLRREWLREDAFSDIEVGGNLGVGGELRHGFNLGGSIGMSRAIFDAPLLIFDAKPRQDTRLVVRTTLGNRKIRVLGFSPQLNWTYNRINSSIALYAIKRSRIELTAARYF